MAMIMMMVMKLMITKNENQQLIIQNIRQKKLEKNSDLNQSQTSTKSRKVRKQIERT